MDKTGLEKEVIRVYGQRELVECDRGKGVGIC